MGDKVTNFIVDSFCDFTNDALNLVKRVHLDVLLQLLVPVLRLVLAGLVWITSFGHRVVGRKRGGRFAPYSAINVTDDTFSPPDASKGGPPAYNIRDFPFEADARTAGLLDGLHEWRTHFLSLCVKAAYEDEEVFTDIVERDWDSFSLVDMLCTEDPEGDESAADKQRSEIRTERRKQLQISLGVGPKHPEIPDEVAKKRAAVVDSFLPQTRAFIIANSNAVILVFRGTEPTNLIQWATDADCKPVERDEVEGLVHYGFYEALFYHSKDGSKRFTVTKHAMFRRICEHLYTATGGQGPSPKALYITGHSLGGALVSVMAHCIAKLAHDDKPIKGWGPGQKIVKSLMKSIMNGGGAYTFAGPLVGDRVFREFMKERFGNSIFRLVHAGDWVPQVPPYRFGFCHHVREYYLTTFGKLLTDGEDIEQQRPYEVRPIGFMLRYMYKMWGGLLLEGESPVRTMERFLLMFVAPGLSDHWPSDYERRLRKYAILRSNKPVSQNLENGAGQANGVNGFKSANGGPHK